jgi:thiosulfate reductase cytochrome b subunit
MGDVTSFVPRMAGRTAEVAETPRHSVLVRITHWIFAFSFFGLTLSGLAIISAHPHLYWGETGNIETPSLFDLPLPTKLGGQSGWGRSMHFQSAWIAVLTGSLYLVSGILTRHFRRQLFPARADLSWKSLHRSVMDHLCFKRPAEEDSYDILQRLSYISVVFVLFPMTILTGLAMSPVVTSVIPQTVTIFGGQQSARTIHFFIADLLVFFVVVHVGMVIVAGFSSRMRGMITGKELS